MIVTRDEVRVGVTPLCAYEHLVHFSEYPSFMSAMLFTEATGHGGHLTFDIGGRRVEANVELAETEPGRFVRWRSEALTESFWLHEAGDHQTDIAAMTELDDVLVPLFDAAPEAMLHERLHMNLKGFKRFCEEHEHSFEA
ncbi:hypothetical protein [Dactylosporangium sp. CS-033363]|uniref:hypothetical protein n=1 Tax=Dactylosporangium sp. CS-033363 TaxID=3239935 RepID=UPI003D8D7BE6